MEQQANTTFYPRYAIEYWLKTAELNNCGDSIKENIGQDFQRENSWTQNPQMDWYRTVDLDFRVEVVNRRKRHLYHNSAVKEQFAYLDVFLVRLGKTKMVMDGLKNDAWKYGSPFCEYAPLTDFPPILQQKMKDFLSLLLKNCKIKDIYRYCTRWCDESYLEILQFTLIDLDIWILVLKIYRKIYTKKSFPTNCLEFLSKLLCLSIKNDKFDFAEEILSCMEKMKHKSDRMKLKPDKIRVCYGAVKGLVQHGRRDILERLMDFKGFSNCLADVMYYSVCCGEINFV